MYDVSKPNKSAIKLWYSLCPIYFLLILINAIFSNLTPYFNIYMSAQIVTEITLKKDIKSVIVIILVTIIGNFLLYIINGLISRLLHLKSTILKQKEDILFNNTTLLLDYCDLETPNIRQMRRKIIESSKINYHGKQSLLNCITRLTNDIINVLFASFLFLEMIILILSSDKKLIAVILFSLLILLVILTIFLNFNSKKKMSIISEQVSETMIEENRIDDAIDCYNMGKDVRLYRQDKLIMNIKEYTFKLHKKAFKELNNKKLLLDIPIIANSSLLQFITYVLVYYYAVIGIFNIGSFIKYIGFIQQLTISIISMFNTLSEMKHNTTFIIDYLNYLNLKPKMTQGNLTINKTYLPNDYIIEFRNVSFKYPTSDVYALNNVSLTITPGKRTAIVGMNGSGKSTFIKLLCRLYDPTSGEILLNGVNIKNYRYDEYLSIFSVVFQDFKLFSFSLKNNITIDKHINDEKIKESLTKVGLKQLVDILPNGINTNIYKDFDEFGVEISGGEAQKVAIARALCKKSPFIILDEPTSALDPITEYEIYTQFNKIVENRTTVYISHRLSSCRFCDQIIVFDKGKQIQKGNHKTLLSEINGKYYELWSSQEQFYID